jgi:hypothetical protein
MEQHGANMNQPSAENVERAKAIFHRSLRDESSIRLAIAQVLQAVEDAAERRGAVKFVQSTLGRKCHDFNTTCPVCTAWAAVDRWSPQPSYTDAVIELRRIVNAGIVADGLTWRPNDAIKVMLLSRANELEAAATKAPEESLCT